MSTTADELKQLMDRFRQMGRAEAEKAIAAGEQIDLERIDSRPFRALNAHAAHDRGNSNPDLLALSTAQ